MLTSCYCTESQKQQQQRSETSMEQDPQSADHTILVPLDRLSMQLIVVDAVPQDARLAWCPRHSLDVEVDSDAAWPVNSNTPDWTPDTLWQQLDSRFHRCLGTLTYSRDQ